MTEAGLVSEVRPIGAFDAVVLKDIGKLTITQGPEPCLTVEAEPEFLPKVLTTVKDGKLVLEIGMSWFDKVSASVTAGLLSKPVHYSITAPSLSSLEVFGLGRISTGSLEAESLSLIVNGTGSITVAELRAQKLDVRLNGMGKASALGGKVGHAIVMINGTGELDAGALETMNAKVTLNGLGKAKVFVVEHLEVEILGAGELTYRGKPALVQDIQGVGRVTCVDER